MSTIQEKSYLSEYASQRLAFVEWKQVGTGINYFSQCAECTFNSAIGCEYYDNKDEAIDDNDIWAECGMCKHWQSR